MPSENLYNFADNDEPTPEEALCGVCMENEWIVELTFSRSGDSEFDIAGKFCGECGSDVQEVILAAQQGGGSYDD